MSKKIIMLSTKQGSENGITVNVYRKDEVYTIPDELYQSFKMLKYCKDFVEIVKEKEVPKEKEIEKKDEDEDEKEKEKANESPIEILIEKAVKAPFNKHGVFEKGKRN